MDALIDSVSRDYLMAAGAAQRDPADGLANAVYLRLMTARGSYWPDPDFGSRLHEIQREKDLPRVAVLAVQYAEQALRPIIDDGRAASIEVTADRPGNGWLALLVVVTAANGRTFTFKYPVKVI